MDTERVAIGEVGSNQWIVETELGASYCLECECVNYHSVNCPVAEVEAIHAERNEARRLARELLAKYAKTATTEILEGTTISDDLAALELEIQEYVRRIGDSQD